MFLPGTSLTEGARKELIKKFALPSKFKSTTPPPQPVSVNFNTGLTTRSDEINLLCLSPSELELFRDCSRSTLASKFSKLFDQKRESLQLENKHLSPLETTQLLVNSLNKEILLHFPEHTVSRPIFLGVTHYKLNIELLHKTLQDQHPPFYQRLEKKIYGIYLLTQKETLKTNIYLMN